MVLQRVSSAALLRVGLLRRVAGVGLFVAFPLRVPVVSVRARHCEEPRKGVEKVAPVEARATFL